MKIKAFNNVDRFFFRKKQRKGFLPLLMILMMTFSCVFYGAGVVASAEDVHTDLKNNADGTYTISLSISKDEAGSERIVKGKLSEWLKLENADEALVSFEYILLDEQGHEIEAADAAKTAEYDASSDTVSWGVSAEDFLEDGYTYTLKVQVSFQGNEVKKTQLIRLFKADADTEELLEGAVFSLSKELDGVFEDIKEVTVSAEGCDLGELEYGKYTLTELKEPVGYTALDETWTFVVDENGVSFLEELDTAKLTTENDVCSIIIYNASDASLNENGRLPSTGGNGTSVYLIGGLLLMISTMLGLFIVKNRQIYN